MQEIDVRFTVEDDVTVKELIHSIGMGMESVHEAVELRNDGFARLLPAEETRERFVGDDEPSEAELQRYAQSGGEDTVSRQQIRDAGRGHLLS